MKPEKAVKMLVRSLETGDSISAVAIKTIISDNKMLKKDNEKLRAKLKKRRADHDKKKALDG